MLRDTDRDAASITPTDSSATRYAISPSSVTRSEGGAGTLNPFAYTITRSGDVSTAGRIFVTLTGTGAAPATADDFAGGFGSPVAFDFNPGDTTRTVFIGVQGDNLAETNEQFAVTLSGAQDGAVITTAVATGFIQDDDTSVFSVSPQAGNRAEGNAGITPFNFVVSRAGQTQTRATVDIQLFGSGPNEANAADFAGGYFTPVTLVFEPGEISKPVIVAVQGDLTPERSEGFTLLLQNPSADAALGVARIEDTIDDDDAGRFTIVTQTAVQAEGASGTTNFLYTIQRTGLTDRAATVDVTLLGSGATPANVSDFVGGFGSPVTIAFAPNETSRTIIVGVQGDTAAESDENFTVTLSNPSVDNIVAGGTANGTILDDDTARFGIEVNTGTVGEGEGGSSTSISFTITRSNVINTAASVDVRLIGTGSNPANVDDFVGGYDVPVTIAFQPGETQRNITVGVRDDALFEPTEGFVLTLSNASAGAAVVDPTAQGFIRNDDSGFSITALDANRPEGSTGVQSFTFTVSRVGAVNTDTSVAVSLLGSGANPADVNDFAGGYATPVRLDFAAGVVSQTVTVATVGDTQVEANEGFTVTLTSLANNADVLVSTATGVIQDDDLTRYSIAAAAPTRPEGAAGALTLYEYVISRTGDLSVASEVDVRLLGSGDNAANASDFAGGYDVPVTFRFEAGQQTRSVFVGVSGDNQLESAEGFSLTLSNPTVGAIGNGVAAGTIQNDDSAFSVSTSNAARDEGGPGQTTLYSYAVTRTGDLSSAASAFVRLIGSGGTSANVNDFVAGYDTPVEFAFAAGESTRLVTIGVAGDNVVEGNETFSVILTNSTANTSIANSTAGGTIRNDDTSYSVRATSSRRLEGPDGVQTEFGFRVDRSGFTGSAGNITATVVGTGAAPTDATDFATPFNQPITLSFAARATSLNFNVLVRGDSAVEQNETFELRLSNSPVGSTIAVGAAQGTIDNDDGAGPAFGDLFADDAALGLADDAALGLGDGVFGADAAVAWARPFDWAMFSSEPVYLA